MLLKVIIYTLTFGAKVQHWQNTVIALVACFTTPQVWSNDNTPGSPTNLLPTHNCQFYGQDDEVTKITPCIKAEFSLFSRQTEYAEKNLIQELAVSGSAIFYETHQLELKLHEQTFQTKSPNTFNRDLGLDYWNYKIGILGQHRFIFSLGEDRLPFGVPYSPNKFLLSPEILTLLYGDKKYYYSLTFDNLFNTIVQLAFEAKINSTDAMLRDNAASLRIFYDFIYIQNTRFVFSFYNETLKSKTFSLALINQAYNKGVFILEYLTSLVYKDAEYQQPKKLLKLILQGPLKNKSRLSFLYQDLDLNIASYREGFLLYQYFIQPKVYVEPALSYRHYKIEYRHAWAINLGVHYEL